MPQQLPEQLTETEETNNYITAIFTEDDNIPPVTKTTPQINEKLLTDENAKDLYMPPSSSIVLKQKKN